MGSFKSVFITAVQVCDGPIDHLHYDVIRAKPDGSCSRSAETGASVWQKRRETSGKARGSETLLGDERDKNNVAQGSHELGKKMSLAPTGRKNRSACALKMVSVRNSKWRMTNGILPAILPRSWTPVHDQTCELELCSVGQL